MVVLTAAQGPNSANPEVLTATVTPTKTNKGIPTGTVVVFTSSNVAIAARVLNANGNVSWSVPAVLASSKFYAVYVGNATYAGATSGTLNGAAALTSLY